MKRTTYFRIARDYTPKDVEFVTLKNDSRGSYRGLTSEGDQGWGIEAPTPSTLGRLFVFLHECAHARRRHRPDDSNY